LPAKKKKARKTSPQEEQLRLFRQILVELQTLNANLVAGRTDRQAAIEPSVPTNDSSDDELEEYE
jgi:hypothetical protein